VNLQDVIELDKRDSLAGKKDEFELPPELIYLDGNSLGALPKTAKTRAREVVEQQWGQGLIRSWNDYQWIDMPVQVGEKIARLIGAAIGQTICCDSVSVNLFKLLACALHSQQGRSLILTDSDNFPADLYIAQNLSKFQAARPCQLRTVARQDIEAELDDSVAVLMLTHVNYKSGLMYDMANITALAHQHGILVIWDLSHSTGAVPLALDDWQVDFAVGCGYKYLNGGPGAPAFIFAAHRHHGNMEQPLQGWMGHKSPFSFSPLYESGSGMLQFLSGTPPVLSMSTLDAALDVFADVQIQNLRQKSLALSSLFLELVVADEVFSELQYQSPENPARRGSQLAFSHPHAFAICQALIARHVIVDYRAPDILRIGFAPLYISFQDVWNSVKHLRQVIVAKSYLQEEYSVMNKVT